MERSRAVAIINGFVPINMAGKYTVMVTGVSPVILDDERGPVRIVNFKAITPAGENGYVDPSTGEHVQGARELFLAGEYQEACNRNLSATQRIGTDFIPQPRETVDIEVTEQVTKKGITGLFVTSVLPRIAVAVKPVKRNYLDEDFDGTDAEEADVTAEDVYSSMSVIALRKEAVAKGIVETAAEAKELSKEELVAELQALAAA